jgi:hypothetical protein
MAENGTKSITFPATNVAGEAKLKRLLETIADYMGTNINIETVMVLQANYPNDRPDFEAILKRLAGSKTGLNMVGRIQAPIDTKKEVEPVPEKEK